MNKEDIDYAKELIKAINKSLKKAKNGSMVEGSYLLEKSKSLYILFGGN